MVKINIYFYRWKFEFSVVKHFVSTILRQPPHSEGEKTVNTWTNYHQLNQIEISITFMKEIFYEKPLK